MNIILDLQGCQANYLGHGIGWYALGLAKAFLRQNTDHEFWLIMNGGLPEKISELRWTLEPYIDSSRILVFDVPSPVAQNNPKNAWRARAAELMREDFICNLKPDIVHISSLFEGVQNDAVVSVPDTAKTAITLYNLPPKPANKKRFRVTSSQLWHEKKIAQMLKADLLLAISEPLRQEAITAFDIPPERIVALHMGEHEEFSWNDAVAARALEALEHTALRADSCSVYRFREPECNTIPPKQYNNLISRLHSINERVRPSLNDLALTAASIAANIPPAKPRRLFVDVSTIRENDVKTGIQRVVRAVLQILFEKQGNEFVVEPVYFCKYTNTIRHARDYASRVGNTDSTPVEFGNGDIFLGLDISIDMLHYGVKPLKYMRDRGVRVFTVIYDLLPVIFPKYFWPGYHSKFATWLQAIADIADGVMCISKAVAHELRDWLSENATRQDLRPLKIGYFHLGSDVETSAPTCGVSPEVKSILDTLCSTRFLMTVGTIEPRKGHAQTIAALEILWQRGLDINFAIVGKAGWLVDPLTKYLQSHPELGKRLFWFDHASDEVLLKLYASANGVVMASEGEGFGLPLIEAARHKVPVLTRDLPVFREICGEHAFYFSGKTPENLADAIQEWLTLSTNGQIPLPEGIRCLTWEESTTQLLDVVIGGNWLFTWDQEQPTGAFSGKVESGFSQQSASN